MIVELLDLVAAAVTDLTAGTTWEQRGSAVEVALDIHTGALPVRSGATADDEEAPFVLVKPGPITFGRPQDGCGCTVVAATWTSGGISDGLAEQDRLLVLLAGLKNAPISGWKLMLPVTGTVGDPETRINPHPYYYFSLELNYKKQI
jgi:hypothetical protein